MVFEVVSPILGFEGLKKVKFSKVDDFFAKIESEDETEHISFTLIDPAKVREYKFEIPDFYKDLLNIEDSESLMAYSIIIIQNPIQNSTMNLTAPLIFNTKSKLVAQVALDSFKYPDFGILEPMSKYL